MAASLARGIQSDSYECRASLEASNRALSVVLLTTGERPSVLALARHYAQLSGVAEVVVAWNSRTGADSHKRCDALEAALRREGLAARLERFANNSLNNRYDARALRLRTEAVLFVDDDVMIAHKYVEMLYTEWLRHDGKSLVSAVKKDARRQEQTRRLVGEYNYLRLGNISMLSGARRVS